MRTILVFLTLITMTPLFGFMVIIASLFGVKDREGSIYDNAPRWWAACLVWAAGIRVRLHNAERMRSGTPTIFVSNHVSWFDVLTLASILPRYKFIGKAELFKIPVFGRAAHAAGMIAIERENRKSAFESYRVAAERIRAGASVVVFPEGTRGRDYSLRQFKKGPFVLAVAAGAELLTKLKKPVVSDEPIGAGATYQPGRRDDQPARFRAAALLTRLVGMGATFAILKA